jgi:hypothetical protein
VLDLLKRYFGFTSFRPLQQEIISDAMTGRDVFALLPTGGGNRSVFNCPLPVDSEAFQKERMRPRASWGQIKIIMGPTGGRARKTGRSGW